MSEIKLLLLDIENSPNVVHTWGLWNQNIAINQIMEPAYVMCWAAKWYGSKEVMFDSIKQSTRKQMIKGIHKLMSEADAVIHYNGAKHDIPLLNQEFILNGLAPPAPFQQIDLLPVVRKQFKFPSNSLAYVSKALGIGSKVAHEGHGLWVKCMAKDPKAWGLMEEYNMNDVVLLESLYELLKPWVRHHPNRGLYVDSVKPVCPNCGGSRLQRRGYRVSKVHKYSRYQCSDCGSWSSSRVAEKAGRAHVVKS